MKVLKIKFNKKESKMLSEMADELLISKSAMLRRLLSKMDLEISKAKRERELTNNINTIIHKEMCLDMANEKFVIKDLVTRIRNSIFQGIKNKGYTKDSHTHEILGCSYEQFKQHIERQFTDGMTWENRDRWHLDHIIPISYADTKNLVYKLNHYTNFQPLWAADNIKKSNKMPKQVPILF